MSIFVWIAAIGALLFVLVICYAVRWSKPRPPKLNFKLAFTHYDRMTAINKAKELDALGYATRMIQDPTDPVRHWQVWIAKE